MHQLLKKFAFDRTTWLCSLACSVALVLWTRGTVGGISPGAYMFYLVLPLAFLCMGRGLLGWLRLPVPPRHAFPLAFLLGSVSAIVLLFLIDVLSSLPLRLSDLIVLLVALLLNATAPDRVTPPPTSASWIPLGVVLLSLVAASLWTQDLRPHSVQRGDDVTLRPWVDIVIFAQIVGQLRADESIIKLGDPDMAGRPAAIYHYASFMLPASVEAWVGEATAMDAVTAIWIPFGIALTGLAGFCLAAEWWDDLAGLAAAAAVLVLPDAPTYLMPIPWYSYRWVSAVSPGLAYGIAAAAVGLIFVTQGVRSNANRFVVAGLVMLALTVVLKAHVAIVAFPLGVAWVVWFKGNWSTRRRLIITLVLAIGAFLTLAVVDRLQIGPNLLPAASRGQVLDYLSSMTRRMQPGHWRTLLESAMDGNPLIHVFGVLAIAIVAPLGGLLVLWAVLVALKFRRRQLVPVDALPVVAFVIYLYCVFLAAPNQRGLIDEVWHRPFVWLYFLLAVWCVGQLVALVSESRRQWHGAGVIVAASVVLLVVPLIQGRTLQQTPPTGPLFTNTHLPTGFLDCARYVRDHAAQYDVVQDQASAQFPYLSAFSERRAYLGRTSAYWAQFLKTSPAYIESLRRAEVVHGLEDAKSEVDIERLARASGIRWYIAGPAQVLEWPGVRLDAPAYSSHGYRVFDLTSQPVALSPAVPRITLFSRVPASGPRTTLVGTTH